MNILSIFLILSFGIIPSKNYHSSFSFFQNEKRQNVDSVFIYKNLIGSWKWNKTFYLQRGGGKEVNAEKNIEVAFHSDKTFIIEENAAIVNKGNWKLNAVTNMKGSWEVLFSNELEKYKYLNLFQGIIQFKENIVSFNDNYLDGCTRFFERKK